MSYLDLEMRWKVRRADLDSDLNDALQFIKRLRSSLDGVSLLIKSDDDLRDAGLDPSFQGPSWLSESQHRVLICELDRLVELLTMRIEDGVERTGGLRNPQFTARCVSWNIRRGTGELAVQATAGGEHRVEVSWQSIVGLAKSLAVNEIVKCQIFEDIDGTSEAVNVVSAGGFRLEGIVSGRSILYKSEGWAGQDLRFSLPFGDNSGVVSGQSVRFAASYRLRQGTILAYVAVDLDWDDIPVERGRCRWWNADKGMGHIKPDVPHGRGDLFCFASEICVDEFAPVVNPASQSMQPGDIVDFVRRCQPERDTDKAVAIKRIGAGRPLPQLARKLPPRR
jgi:cold shock CspA family protein